VMSGQWLAKAEGYSNVAAGGGTSHYLLATRHEGPM